MSERKMMIVNEVSRLTGVSIRTLQYYDKIGLLPPAGYTEAGYRLYDDETLRKLQIILLFKELEFPLKEIRRIIESPDFDRDKALEQQIHILELKKEHIENLIDIAKGVKNTGVENVTDFTAFDTTKIDEYIAEAREYWGETDAYKEFEEKNAARTSEDNNAINAELMKIFVEFGGMMDMDPASEKVQKQVKKLQDFITYRFYKCTNEILSSLGQAYSAEGEMNRNIDKAGGKGTGAFADKAIQIYCSK